VVFRLTGEGHNGGMASARVLFQGDSITDCGRDRNDPLSLGFGYAALAAAQAFANEPALDIEFMNRGIGGHRVYDLEARWSEDCIDLRPDVVSILIGINDTWRRYDSNVVSPINEFKDSLQRICERVTNELQAHLVLMEPFVLPVPADREQWREDLDPRIQAVRAVARDLGATLVPLDGIFAAAACDQPPAFWTPDGVHPSLPGHALIAKAVLEAMGL